LVIVFAISNEAWARLRADWYAEAMEKERYTENRLFTDLSTLPLASVPSHTMKTLRSQFEEDTVALAVGNGVLEGDGEMVGDGEGVIRAPKPEDDELVFTAADKLVTP